MAVKLPDTLVPMADFPSAYAKDVQFTDGENLQDKLDKGKLGSSSSGTGLTEEQANNIEKIPSIEGIVTSNSQAITNKADKDHKHTDYATKDYVNNAITSVTGGSVINQNGNKELLIWAGTQEEYNNLITYEENTVYLIEGSGGSSSVLYKVTTNLSNVTISNSETFVEKGTVYTTDLLPSLGYEISSVTITMGGTDITSSSYSNGTITISNVSGDIIITANAIKSSSNSHIVGYTLGHGLNSTTGLPEEGKGKAYTSPINISSNFSFTSTLYCVFRCYNASNEYLGTANNTTYSNSYPTGLHKDGSISLLSGTTYIKILLAVNENASTTVTDTNIGGKTINITISGNNYIYTLQN